jgi:hypothetical protein
MTVAKPVIMREARLVRELRSLLPLEESLFEFDGGEDDGGEE